MQIGGGFLLLANAGLYGKPLLQFPLPLSPGMDCESKGDEYSDDEKYNVNISGKVLPTPKTK